MLPGFASEPFDDDDDNRCNLHLIASQRYLTTTGRTNRSLPEDPRCPDTVAPSSYHRDNICSCWLSRPGPVIGFSSGVFQGLLSGKYTLSSRTDSLPDDHPISRERSPSAPDTSPQPSRVSADSESAFTHRTDNARTPGRTHQSSEECPRPPYTVESSPSSSPGISTSHQRRPGPVYGCRGGDFRAQPSGEYMCANSSGPALNRRQLQHSGDSTSRCTSFITVYYQNAVGMRTKTKEFFLALASCDYDIIALSETWLQDDIVDAELSSNYKLFRQNRNALTSDRRRGGGVLIAVRKSVELECTRVLSNGYEHLEQVAVRVQVQKQSVYVCCIYIRPNSDPDIYASHGTAVQELLDLSTNDDSVIVTGDYNLPHLSWFFDADVDGFIPLNASSEQELALTENLISTGLQQICSLTNVNGRILDLAFVNDAYSVELIEPPSSILRTDRHHKPFVLRVDLRHVFGESISLNEYEPDFNRCDYDQISEALNGIDWENLLQNQNTNASTTIFYDILYGIIEQSLPLRRISSNRTGRLPWSNADLRHRRNQLRKARKRFFRTSTQEHKVTVERLESEYEALQASLYRDYLNRVQVDLNENPTSFWSYVRSRKRSNVLPTRITLNNATAESPIDIANTFADFFSSVFVTTDPATNSSYLDSLPTFDLRFPRPEFSPMDIQAALSQVDPSKGAGPDRLPPAFIKSLSAVLATPVCYIFNRSLSEGVFPDEWKLASIIPIFKTGSTLNAENYRPISILSCLPKVFEVLIHKGMYAAAHDVISDFQHGFVKKRSTVTNLMSYVSTLNANLEKFKQTDAIYFDFSKAFDKVPHLHVITKLTRLGFPRWLTAWLQSYLCGRQGYVRLGTAHSRKFLISSGVPQGSHLGPLLFVLFINDICSRLQSQKLLYADDLKVFRTVSSVIDCLALQQDIDKINEWCVLNGMVVNSSKCKVISFTRSVAPITHDYTFDSHGLDRVTSIRDLGLLIDRKLNFAEHVSATTAKAFAVLGFLRRNTADFENINALKTLYISLVRSILEYAVQVWSPHYSNQRDRLEKVQRRFTLYALRRLPWRNGVWWSSYNDRCTLLRMESLEQRRVFLQRMFVFDVLTNRIDCPQIREEINVQQPTRVLRNQPILRIPFHRTIYGYNRPIDRCCRLFNPVSNEFVPGMSRECFKQKIVALR